MALGSLELDVKGDHTVVLLMEMPLCFREAESFDLSLRLGFMENLSFPIKYRRSPITINVRVSIGLILLPIVLKTFR